MGRQVVTQELIDWADRIFVMDEKYDCHLTKLKSMFNTAGKKIDVLCILDIYDRGDLALVQLLKLRLAEFGILVT